MEEIVFTCATELEFWVKSPREDAPIEALSSSQMMQEQYWQRTRGNVRTALEQAVEALEAYGLEPEMGHKECGGIRGQMDPEGHMTHAIYETAVQQYQLYPRLAGVFITVFILIYILKLLLNTTTWEPETHKKTIIAVTIFLLFPFMYIVRFGGGYNYDTSIYWENAARMLRKNVLPVNPILFIRWEWQ